MSSDASRAANRRASKEADDVELAALRRGRDVPVQLEEALFDNEVADDLPELLEIDVLTDGESGDAVRQTEEVETARSGVIAQAGEVIQARNRELREDYPFVLNGNTLAYRGSKTLAYEFCLITSSVEDVRRRRYEPFKMAFERLSGRAMSLLLGPHSQWLRIGFPPEEGLETFPKIAQELESAMPAEWQLDSSSKTAKDPNDGGADTVVWVKLDEREGTLIFVGNCTCGRNWHSSKKHHERPSESLQNVFIWPKPSRLFDYFALPFHVYDGYDWNDASHRGCYVLDRVRLVKLLAQAAETVSDRGPAAELFSIVRSAEPEYRIERVA